MGLKKSFEDIGKVIANRYDDGGFTGGNVERPALKRLLADIEAGNVDVVVVYKVDRLSRSLLDFGRLMELFTKQRTSFGSALFRNAIKFAPWESGHIVANQFVFSDDAEIASWVYGSMVISFIFPLWWIVSIFFTGRTPYDRASCTQVVHTDQVPAKSG